MSARQVVSNNVEVALKSLFVDAMKAAFPAVEPPAPLVQPGKFSDFQCNNAMGLAKVLSSQKPPVKMAPKDIGKQVIAALPANDLI